MDITIKAIDTLHPWLEDLKKIYLEAYKEDYLYAYREPSRVKRYLKWLIKHTEGGFFVAFYKGRPVGFIVVQPDCRFQGENIPEIHELVVDPKYQNLGIAKRLMETALDYLAKRGFKKVALWVGEKNTKAKRFYERLGFRITSRQGAWLRMEKELQEGSSEKRSKSLSNTKKASTTSESTIVSSGV